MPRGDGRGPTGFGPMTGRGAGFCSGYDVPGYANPAMGRGPGFGRASRCYGGGGFGRGYRRMYYATGLPGWMRSGAGAWGQAAYGPAYSPYAQEAMRPSKEQEIGYLKRQSEFLIEELEAVRGRLSELSGSQEYDEG